MRSLVLERGHTACFLRFGVRMRSADLVRPASQRRQDVLQSANDARALDFPKNAKLLSARCCRKEIQGCKSI